MTNRLLEIKKAIGVPKTEATVCFLIRDNKILLAMKKRGFGVGKWNGVGGKRKKEESVIEAAKKEAYEEINITPTSLEKVADINFYFLNKPKWNQRVIAFLAKSWTGTEKESEEMKPKWLKLDKIPYSKMWPADAYWIKQILEGKKVKADILFSDDQQLIEKSIKAIT